MQRDGVQTPAAEANTLTRPGLGCLTNSRRWCSRGGALWCGALQSQITKPTLLATATIQSTVTSQTAHSLFHQSSIIHSLSGLFPAPALLCSGQVDILSPPKLSSSLPIFAISHTRDAALQRQTTFDLASWRTAWRSPGTVVTPHRPAYRGR